MIEVFATIMVVIAEILVVVAVILVVFASIGVVIAVFANIKGQEIESMIFHIFPNIDEKFFGLILLLII